MGPNLSDTMTQQITCQSQSQHPNGPPPCTLPLTFSLPPQLHTHRRHLLPTIISQPPPSPPREEHQQQKCRYLTIAPPTPPHVTPPPSPKQEPQPQQRRHRHGMSPLVRHTLLMALQSLPVCTTPPNGDVRLLRRIQESRPVHRLRKSTRVARQLILLARDVRRSYMSVYKRLLQLAAEGDEMRVAQCGDRAEEIIWKDGEKGDRELLLAVVCGEASDWGGIRSLSLDDMKKVDDVLKRELGIADEEEEGCDWIVGQSNNKDLMEQREANETLKMNDSNDVGFGNDVNNGSDECCRLNRVEDEDDEVVVKVDVDEYDIVLPTSATSASEGEVEDPNSSSEEEKEERRVVHNQDDEMERNKTTEHRSQESSLPSTPSPSSIHNIDMYGSECNSRPVSYMQNQTLRKSNYDGFKFGQGSTPSTTVNERPGAERDEGVEKEPMKECCTCKYGRHEETNSTSTSTSTKLSRNAYTTPTIEQMHWQQTALENERMKLQTRQLQVELQLQSITSTLKTSMESLNQQLQTLILLQSSKEESHFTQ